MQQRLPSLLDPPIAFAHRGGGLHAPENTLEAFELGLRLGATGLETDAWVTADGVVVLDHDGVVRRGARKRPIAEMTRDELPPHIPTLRELLERCGTDYDLSLDLKAPAAAAPTVEVIRSIDDAMLQRVWLCEPHLERAIALRAELDAAGKPSVRLLQSTRLANIKQTMEQRAATLAEHGIDGINMHRTDWNGGLVALFHRFGLMAFGWDLQHSHEIQTGIRMGLDAVYSDRIDVMADVFRSEVGS